MRSEETEMNGLSEDQERLRAYLLGNLVDEELMHKFEERILLDDAFNDQLARAEDSLIEDFLDGELTTEDSERFQQFFLFSNERRGKLRVARKLRDYAASSLKQGQHATVKPVEKKSWFRWGNPSLGFAAAALLLMATGVVIWRVSSYPSNVDRGIAQLRLAYQGTRPTESRTSITFSYMPVSVTRGDSVKSRDDGALRRSELYLAEAAQDPSDAKAHHALGILYLTDRKFDEALREFDLALSTRPNDPALLNDVAAARLEKANAAIDAGRGAEGLESLARALQFVNKSLELSPRFVEALFNRALTLQKMKLAAQATEAWELYLQVDATSPWANEARENLEELKKSNASAKSKTQILDDFIAAYESGDDAQAWRIVSQTKELITGSMVQIQLLGRVLASKTGGDDESAKRYSRALVYLGNLEQQRTGDLFFAEVATFYTDSSEGQRKVLNLAHEQMNVGYDHVDASRWKDAIEVFEQAKALFTQAGDRWSADIAEYQLCYCLHQIEDRIIQANERLRALSESLESRRHLWLGTIVDAAVASTFTILGDRSKAISYNQRSLTAATGLSDSYSIQKANNQLTHEYWLLGQTEKVLESIFRSLDHGELYFQSRRQQNRNLIFATEGLYRLGLYDTAAAFAREQAYVAENEVKSKWFSHTAHIIQALIYAERGSPTSALNEIDAAVKIADSFQDEDMRARQRVKTMLILGHLQRKSGDCDSAIGNYDSVIAHYSGTEFGLHLYEARKSRLACLIELKKDAHIKSEIAAVIDIFEANRIAITKEADRNIFFDREQTVYDLAADYAYSTLNDSDRAFSHIEISRARSLLKATNPDAPVLTLSDARRAFPDRVQMLYYAVLSDKLVIWYITESDTRSTVVSIDPGELKSLIDLHRKNILEQRDREQIVPTATELFRLLVEPVGASLRPDVALCIVADKDLHLVPFATLISPATNTYLVESFPLLYSPSASVFIYETRKASKKTSSNAESILAVGNPPLSQAEYSELRALPDAEVEARSVAALYAGFDPLIGVNATRRLFTEAAPRADVIHFAGHYVPAPGAPLASKLLLAESDLTADEVSRWRLPVTKLIILSACSTGVEGFYYGEGAFSSARAFLTAGVPLVIASQWPVDSRATSRLMVSFHTKRKQIGGRSVDALQQAQVEMLREKDSPYSAPYYWRLFHRSEVLRGTE